jgi:hypothetical protein
VLPVILRCTLDGLLLPAQLDPATGALTVFDGAENFALEAIEAVYYQLTSATEQERLTLQRHYRLLRPAADFQWLAL